MVKEDWDTLAWKTSYLLLKESGRSPEYIRALLRDGINSLVYREDWNMKE